MIDTTRTTKNDWLRWLAMAAVYFICCIAFYADIGQDMGAQYYLPIAIPMLAGLVLVQYGSHLPLFSRATLPNLLTGLAWCSAFPLLYAWTYQSIWYQSLICFDFLVGTGEFLMLTALECVLFRLGWKRVFSLLFALLNALLLVVPFMQYAYYVMVWHCLTPASIMAVYLTNYRESLDFIHSNIGVIPTILILASFTLFLFWAYRCHLRVAEQLEDGTTAGRTGALAAVLAAALATCAFYLPQTSIASLFHDVDAYVKQTQEYSVTHDDRYDELTLDGTTTASVKTPGTVIVVIGESASRNYMKAFTPSFPYDDTPWMSAQAGNPDYIQFYNAYSSWSQTVPVLQRALTEQSQYNDKEFFNSNSIIDVARKAGYETWWFSNQGRYGQYDSAITLVAKTADHAFWTDDSYNFSDKYDEELLPYLQQVDPDKNNFIVLHIMGSHIYYNNRYPPEFNQFETAEGDSIISSTESYANSILYTDHILQEIHDYAQQNLHLTAMLYFSDHGENLAISHNPDVFSFDMVRIPMAVWLSPRYRSAFPMHTQALRSHQFRYFTNDMLYDTISGLLNAPSNHYDAGQDFASPTYRFNRSTLTTMLGQHSLLEDPDGSPEE